MTEAEWLACSDIPRLISARRNQGQDRKLRLFACACARRVWDQLPVGPARAAVETSEAAADSEGMRANLEAAYEVARRAWGDAGLDWISAISTGMGIAIPDAWGAALYTADHAPQLAIPAGTPSRKRLMAAEREAQLALFRDIFGNPFRHVAFDPGWHTSTAVALARQMYDSRDFSAMPILADALQDAGCDNTNILDHCRGPGPHVRGCWIVDLILGKE